MTRKYPFLTPEILTINALMAASVLSLIFMPSLVAAPKLLFGRSLSAITPSLFPSIVLSLMAIMCAAALVVVRTRLSSSLTEERMDGAQWLRAVILFGIMTLYALTMLPFGFLISTAIATALVALQMGARSVIQIGLVSLVGPIALYLAATRLLAVSLPELNAIELVYARLFAL